MFCKKNESEGGRSAISKIFHQGSMISKWLRTAVLKYPKLMQRVLYRPKFNECDPLNV